jgi:hypothetical protein
MTHLATSVVWSPIRPCHRWLGIVLCLLFASWFGSGAVLLFVPFPSLNQRDQIAHAPQLDPETIRRTPVQALASVNATPVSIRLVQRLDGPIYVVRDKGGRLHVVAASDGVLDPITPTYAAAIAAAFARQSVDSVSGPVQDDQWTVHQRFDPWRPFYRVTMSDTSKTQLYVSAQTGEVVQRTTLWQRRWNWVGAVTHWIYPTVLRRHWMAWNRVVWLLSLTATLTVFTGIALGLHHSVRRYRDGKGGWSGYRGWMRWHHGLGLLGSIVLLPWITSGWLSMDHGLLFSTSEVIPRANANYQGDTLQHAAALWGLDRVRTLGPANEIRFESVAGHALAQVDRPNDMVVIEAGTNDRYHEASAALVIAGVRHGWPGRNIVGIDRPLSSDLYVAAESLPDGVRRVVLGGQDPLWLYVDRGGVILAALDRSRRLYDGVFYAVHTLHFPFLSTSPRLHAGITLLTLIVGLVMSMTGLIVGVLGLRRRRRSVKNEG